MESRSYSMPLMIMPGIKMGSNAGPGMKNTFCPDVCANANFMYVSEVKLDIRV